MWFIILLHSGIFSSTTGPCALKGKQRALFFFSRLTSFKSCMIINSEKEFLKIKPLNYALILQFAAFHATWFIKNTPLKNALRAVSLFSAGPVVELKIPECSTLKAKFKFILLKKIKALYLYSKIIMFFYVISGRSTRKTPKTSRVPR